MMWKITKIVHTGGDGMVDWTSIAVTHETKQKLKKLKRHKQETYDEVINRILELLRKYLKTCPECGNFMKEFKAGHLCVKCGWVEGFESDYSDYNKL